MTEKNLVREQSIQRLIVASASPRRRQLLAQAGIEFETIESGVVERQMPAENAPDFAQRMACEKALAVSAAIPQTLVLGADTVVEIDGQILGKPRDTDEARRMLLMLSGRTHRVFTGIALARGGRILEQRTVGSNVKFRTLSIREIDEYVATAEPYDKAGGYAIQGDAGEFVAAVEGSAANVMGLPIDEVLAALAANGLR